RRGRATRADRHGPDAHGRPGVPGRRRDGHGGGGGRRRRALLRPGRPPPRPVRGAARSPRPPPAARRRRLRAVLLEGRAGGGRLMPIAGEVAVVGYASTPFGVLHERGYLDLLAEAALGAVADAGLEPDDVEAAWLGTAEPSLTGLVGDAGTAV